MIGNKRKIIGVLLLPVAGVLINAARAEYLKPRDAGAQQPAAIRLKADLSDKILYVEQGGKVVKTYTFADGSAKYRTPKGTFRVGKVIWNPAWVPPDSKWRAVTRPPTSGATTTCCTASNVPIASI